MIAHPKRKGPSVEREQDEVDLLRLNDRDPDLYPARAAKELVAHIVRAQASVCIDRARGERLSHRSEEYPSWSSRFFSPFSLISQ